MEKTFKIENLKDIKSDLPDSVLTPQPAFKSPQDALQFFSRQLEMLAQKKEMTLDEMKAAANLYKFGPEESFAILGLFDTVRALRSAE